MMDVQKTHSSRTWTAFGFHYRGCLPLKPLKDAGRRALWSAWRARE
jgi:hypothetical protein